MSEEMTECINCVDKPAQLLSLGEFKTDLFCSWDCLGEYVELADD